MRALLFYNLFHATLIIATASPFKTEEIERPDSGESDVVRIIKNDPYKRRIDLAPSPLYVDDGARFRLEFVNPGNDSIPDFRSSAKVVAGQWQLPEVPVKDDLTDDKDPRFTETTTKKSPGFFKGIEDFFKHSFHMDKTTVPVHTTSSTQTPVIQPAQDIRNELEEARRREVQIFRKKQPQNFRGRDATFNFHIKAVAL